MKTDWATWTHGYCVEKVLPGLIGLVGVLLLYALQRRAPKRWWIVAWCASTVLVAALLALSPWLQRRSLHQSQDPNLLAIAQEMARDYDLGRVNVLERSADDGKIGASVTGWFGTTSIVVNQATLTRCSNNEVRFIIFHETGHLLLHHAWGWLAIQAGLVLAFFASAAVSLKLVVHRWESAGIEDGADIAGLPLIHLCLVMVLFLSTPCTNWLARYGENQADHFALEATRLPDAAALAFLKLGESRDLDPNPVLEMMFFGHPSGRERIEGAMRWKSEHLHDETPTPHLNSREL